MIWLLVALFVVLPLSAFHLGVAVGRVRSGGWPR